MNNEKVIIETKRIIIKELSLDMAYDIHINSLDEDNKRFVPDEVFDTEGDAKEAIKYLMEQYANLNGPLVYAVIEKTSNKNIGYVQIIPFENDKWEIGYHIAKPYTKQGYAKEATNEFVAYAMKQLKLYEIYGVALKENIASIHVLEATGFQKIFEGLGDYQGEKREIVVYIKKI